MRRLLRWVIWIQMLLAITHAALLLAAAYVDLALAANLVEQEVHADSLDLAPVLRALNNDQTKLYNVQLVIYTFNVSVSILIGIPLNVYDVLDMQNLLTDCVMVCSVADTTS
jgi:hypothetical protein